MGKFGWYFVGFCALFIVVYGTLKVVSNMRVQEECRELSASIFNWKWPGQNWESKAELTDVEVVSKGDNDAVVKIKAKQTATAYKPGDEIDSTTGRSQTEECTATINLYKLNDQWIIGSVEL